MTTIYLLYNITPLQECIECQERDSSWWLQSSRPWIFATDEDARRVAQRHFEEERREELEMLEGLEEDEADEFKRECPTRLTFWEGLQAVPEGSNYRTDIEFLFNPNKPGDNVLWVAERLHGELSVCVAHEVGSDLKLEIPESGPCST